MHRLPFTGACRSVVTFLASLLAPSLLAAQAGVGGGSIASPAITQTVAPLDGAAQ
jgi:hypothetical protein